MGNLDLHDVNVANTYCVLKISNLAVITKIASAYGHIARRIIRIIQVSTRS